MTRVTVLELPYGTPTAIAAELLAFVADLRPGSFVAGSPEGGMEVCYHDPAERDQAWAMAGAPTPTLTCPLRDEHGNQCRFWARGATGLGVHLAKRHGMAGAGAQARRKREGVVRRAVAATGGPLVDEGAAAWAMGVPMVDAPTEAELFALAHYRAGHVYTVERPDGAWWVKCECGEQWVQTAPEPEPDEEPAAAEPPAAGASASEPEPEPALVGLLAEQHPPVEQLEAEAARPTPPPVDPKVRRRIMGGVPEDSTRADRVRIARANGVLPSLLERWWAEEQAG